MPLPVALSSYIGCICSRPIYSTFVFLSTLAVALFLEFVILDNGWVRLLFPTLRVRFWCGPKAVCSATTVPAIGRLLTRPPFLP